MTIILRISRKNRLVNTFRKIEVITIGANHHQHPLLPQRQVKEVDPEKEQEWQELLQETGECHHHHLRKEEEMIVDTEELIAALLTKGLETDPRQETDRDRAIESLSKIEPPTDLETEARIVVDLRIDDLEMARLAEDEMQTVPEETLDRGLALDLYLVRAQDEDLGRDHLPILEAVQGLEKEVEDEDLTLRRRDPVDLLLTLVLNQDPDLHQHVEVLVAPLLLALKVEMPAMGEIAETEATAKVNQGLLRSRVTRVFLVCRHSICILKLCLLR